MHVLCLVYYFIDCLYINKWTEMIKSFILKIDLVVFWFFFHFCCCLQLHTIRGLWFYTWLKSNELIRTDLIFLQSIKSCGFLSLSQVSLDAQCFISFGEFAIFFIHVYTVQNIKAWKWLFYIYIRLIHSYSEKNPKPRLIINCFGGLSL